MVYDTWYNAMFEPNNSFGMTTRYNYPGYSNMPRGPLSIYNIVYLFGKKGTHLQIAAFGPAKPTFNCTDYSIKTAQLVENGDRSKSL